MPKTGRIKPPSSNCGAGNFYPVIPSAVPRPGYFCPSNHDTHQHAASIPKTGIALTAESGTQIDFNNPWNPWLEPTMMKRSSLPFRLLLLLPLATLPLAGCGIPGGVAYAIKSIDKKDGSSGASQAQSTPETSTSTSQRAEEPPPPAPEPAPRDSIKVEELSAPSH